ncbi:MAG: sodium-dependent transporter [Clostridiales bacterium]|nr:sodium-dependent transporter [Clostridiales bacterium]
MREQWNTKLGFILAAIGSAVGLGNLWRFPYIAATNGGGAFIFPYLFAILTAGIPILILEYTLGKTYRSGAPGTFARINRKFEWLGWAQVLTSFIITVYYFAIVVWVLSYIAFSFGNKWGEDTGGFFYGFLGITDSMTSVGGIQTNMLVPFFAVWAIVGFVMYRGINKGIDIACKICLPILLLCTVIIVIRGITLPGAIDGLAYMFTPDWSAIAKPDVWVAAYGQVFFSLSIAFAIMISYSSYLPKKEDVVNTAFLTACTNHGFEIFAGIGIFSIIGYMAYAQGVGVEDVAAAGIGLAFVVFPTAISTLPALNTLFGILFFVSLFTAGITSLISIIQAVITGIQDKWEMSHTKATTVVLVPAFVISFLFITGAGLYFLDLADYIANNIGIVMCGVIEVILIGWFFKPEKLRKAANEYSNFSVGQWWTWCLKVVTVIVLGYTTVTNLITYFRDGYEGYPMWIGFIIIGFMVVGTIVLTAMKGRKSFYEKPDDAPGYDD